MNGTSDTKEEARERERNKTTKKKKYDRMKIQQVYIIY